MSGGKSEPDAGITLLVICGITLFFGWVIWHFFKQPLLEGLRWLRFVELWILNLFLHRYGDCLNWLTNAKFMDQDPSQDMIRWTNGCYTTDYLQTTPADETGAYYTLAIQPIKQIGREVTLDLHWLLAGIFAFFGYYMYFVSWRNKLRQRHTLETFIATQAKMWPVISPIVKFNPIKSSARAMGETLPKKLPIFAEALSPEEWIALNNIDVTNGVAEREATRHAFLQQLGPRWNGIAACPPYMQALYAAYALKGVQRREESDDLLGRISLCWSEKGGFKINSKLGAEIRQLLKDKNVGGKADEIARQHAYRTTAMLAVLRWARSMGGVLAPAQFLWLRAVDRALWYPLNNLGRRSFHTEGAGALAHFMAEQNAKKPLPIARIDTAVVTLNQYLANNPVPIPSVDGRSARTDA